MTLRDYWLWVKRRPRLLGGVWVILILWIGTDLALRVWAGRDRSLREFAPPSPVAIRKAPEAASINAAIASWFPVVTEAEKSPPPREIVPQGIFRSAGQSVAIVLLKANEAQPEERRRLVIGDSVEGSTVEAIDARRIVLTKDGQSRELVLLRGKP